MRGLKLAVISSCVVVLSGCSTISSWVVGEDDYRQNEAQLAKQLEMPPNFILPVKPNPALTLEFADTGEIDKVPSLAVEGVRVESNLSERWLVLEQVPSDQAWSLVIKFLETEGFAIKESRADIGVIETEFLPRQQVAPVELEEGTLSRLFNSWRPELASGIYDRFTVRVEAVGDTATRVYFRHHMMQAETSDTTTAWRVRPYDSMVESVALYKAMTFLGVTQQGALAQIESAQLFQEIYEGDEFSSILLAAGRDQAWQYIQSMIYRGNWTIESQAKASYQLWLKVPEKKTKGFFTRLFSSNEPQLVRLALLPYQDDANKTEVTLSAPQDAEPLTAGEKQRIFEELGLLAK